MSKTSHHFRLHEPFEHEKYQLEHATAPLGFLNPTRARFQLDGAVPSDAAASTEPGDSEGSEDIGKERHGQHQKDEDVPAENVRFLWRARDNRKGRHALLVQKPRPGEETRYLTPRRTTHYKEVFKNIKLTFTYFPVWDISWLVALIFTLGSVVWVINGFFAWLPLVAPSTEFHNESYIGGGVTAFIGAIIFFETGSILLIIEAVNSNNSGCFGWAVEQLLEDNQGASGKPMYRFRASRHHCRHHHQNRRNFIGKPSRTLAEEAQLAAQKSKDGPSWRWFPSWHDLRTHYIHELGFLAGAAQLFGATIFGISGFTALPGINNHLEPQRVLNGAYWIPQVIGGSGFIVSSSLYMLETQQKWWKPAFHILGWHIGFWNFVGAIGFTLCGALGMAYGNSGAQYQASLSTFWGSWAFLIGSYLQLYESLDTHPVEEVSSQNAFDTTKSETPPKPVSHSHIYLPSNTPYPSHVSTFRTRPLSTVRLPKPHALLATSRDLGVQSAQTQRWTWEFSRGYTRVTKAQKKKKPEYWISLLESLLSKDLGLSFRGDARTDFDERKDFDDVLKILQDAKSFTGVDLLAFMVLGQGRHKAVVCLVEILLKPAESLPGSSVEQTLPSNIAWPQFSFSKLVKQPIELDADSHVKRQSMSNAHLNWDSNVGETGYERVMPLLWQSLAELIIASIRQSPEDAKRIMHTVLLILAKIHHVDLIPSAVYTYAMPKAPTNIQQSPILSLLNSRILSTLSDAVWQAQQEDELARAAAGDSSRQDLTYDEALPGGRFRLKLRELGPEVWIEFILWCCVEGGYPSAGARIIRSLHRDTEYPWSAVHWTTSGQNTEKSTPSIDWDRVRRRPGGTVGGFEAYSREDPFVQMQPRTISAEVVLALTDCLINSVDSFSFRSTTGIEKKISDVLSFLEPHCLAPAYFDYLAVRLLQTENFGLRTGPHGLENWALTVSHLHSLRTMKDRPFQKPSLSYDYILQHTLFQAGFWHQVLQAYIESHRATKAVDVLTRIQQLVDTSKLEAIGEFMSGVGRSQDGFFTSRPAKRHTEYIDSHGQIPEYKLLLIINLVTSAKLFGLSDWLLHSSDVDGPLIPVEVRGRPSIASGLSRHAIAKDDLFLLRSVIEQSARSDRKPTVNLLRALVNAQIHFRAWDDVSFLLRQLKSSETGGYSPSIVANLAASILQLEVESTIQQRDGATQDLLQAEELLVDILSGRFNGPASDFTVLQRKFFRQQVKSLLHVLQAIPDSSLGDLVAPYLDKYPVGNLPQLTRATFNVIFSAIVEVKGALEGRRIWEIFCTPNGWVSPSNDNIKDHVRPSEFEDSAESAELSSTLSTNSPADDWSGLPLSTSDEVPRDETIEVDSGFSDPQAGQQNAELSLPPGLGIENDRSEVPFVSSGNDATSASGFQTNPVVVPDLYTLQILVNAALAEKEVEHELSSEARTELDDLLAWATALAKSWGLSSDDIETELNIPVAFHSWLLSPYPGLNKKRQRFMDRHGALNVSDYFRRGLLVPRSPSVRYGSMKSGNVRGLSTSKVEGT